MNTRKSPRTAATVGGMADTYTGGTDVKHLTITEARARHEKVQLLTDILRSFEVDAETAELFTNDQWQKFADLATEIRREDDPQSFKVCHNPSPKTRRAVINNLVGDPDPFAMFEGVA